MQEGTGFNITGAPLAGMQARGVDVGGREELQRGIGNAAAAAGGVVDSFIKMQEYRARADERIAMQREQQLTEAEMQKRLQAAPGTALSFMNEDGSLNREKVDDFALQYKERMEALRTSRWDVSQMAERDKEWEESMQNNVVRMMGQVELHELENIKRAGQAILEECAQNNDSAGYVNEIARQVEAGLLSEREGRLKNLAYGKSVLRRAAGSGGSVKIGDGEYSGLAAALRAQQIKDGYKGLPKKESGEKKETAEERVSVDELVKPERKLDTQTDYTLQPVTDAPASMGDEWQTSGDFAGVLKTMSQSEIDGLTSLCVNDGAIRQDVKDDGTVEFTAESLTAPEAVERVAAIATAEGSVNEASAKAMVARMAMSRVMEDPDADASLICSMFDKSGIYEALGEGDTEAGKNHAMSIIHEMIRRGKEKKLRLENESIGKMVEAKVSEASFGEGSEWKSMERIGVIDGKWEKPKDEAGRKAWFEMFEVYKKYRDRFNPQHTVGEADRKEFAEKAEEFSKWYAKTVGKELKRAEMDAARDWYTAMAYESLLNKIGVDADGKAVYESYSSDVAVVRAVLEEAAPKNLGVEERQKMLEKKESDAEWRSENFRRMAAEDYKRLRDMKQVEKENSEKAQKAKAAAEAKAKKEAEDEQKRLEAIAARKLNVARAMPRQAEWLWDGEESTDGAMPTCTLPAEEYDRLVGELGYDGTQIVYVQVQGAKIQVTGANKHGQVLMNAAAVAKLQKKPNTKKGEKWKYNGVLGFSYYFKNMSANN